MQPDILAQPKDRGGLNIHPLETRASAQKAWLYRRTCKHPILWISSHTPIAKSFHNHARKFTSQSNIFAELIFSQLETPNLIKGQLQLETQLNCSVLQIFAKINKLKIRKAIKQVYWKFYNKCLTINKQLPDKRPHDRLDDDHKHFALNCKLVKEIQQQASSINSDLTTEPFKYDPRKAILLEGINEQQNVLYSIVMWTQWLAHNKWTHKNTSIPTLPQTKSTIISEIKQYVRAQIAKLKSQPPRTEKEKAVQLTKLTSIQTQWHFVFPL